MSKTDEQKPEISNEIAVINESTIRDKIYIIRNVQVMLDFELAEIYGYSTKRFNEQVKNNIEKFDDDFRFQLTKEEFDILRSKKSTSSWGGTRYLPWVFTETGLYMLMTVLKGDLATRQTKALIRTFHIMKNYIINNQNLTEQHDYLQLSMKVSDTQQAVQTIQAQLLDQGEKPNDLFGQMQDTVKKSELSPIMLDFSNSTEQSEFIFFEGQALSAAEGYRKIYKQVKKTIHIVDDYIDSKTLHLLQVVQPGIDITIFSDNNYGKLKASDYADFQTETPNVPITFIHTQKMSHDRFIILDHNTADERIFHCGASSKDAGKRMTAIMEFENGTVKNAISGMITQMLSNPALILK